LSFIERRRAPRVELNLRVVIRWRDGAERREAQTISNNVTVNGIYFVLSEAIKNGTPVELDVTLPHKVIWSRCLGHIQRCELKEGAIKGMAAEIEEYEFVYK
jgi:hypothetical protein